MGEVVILPVVRIERHESEAHSLRSDRAYARHNHEADRAFWIGGPRDEKDGAA